MGVRRGRGCPAVMTTSSVSTDWSATYIGCPGASAQGHTIGLRTGRPHRDDDLPHVHQGRPVLLASPKTDSYDELSKPCASASYRLQGARLSLRDVQNLANGGRDSELSPPS